MFEKRKVQVLFGLGFASLVLLIVILSSRSSSTSTNPKVLETEMIGLSKLSSNDESARNTALNPITYEHIQVAMCSSLPDRDGHNESLEFCKCEPTVVSCDFSGFDSSKPTSVELGAFWAEDTVKRVCICGAPANLEVYLGEHFLGGVPENAFSGVDRVDLYQMDGQVQINRAFSLHFSGDVYMSGLRLLRQMGKWEYGRGYDIPLEDTTHLSCCSKIATPKFSSPTFFMEHSTVDSVQNAGINDGHLWKNLVFQNVTFNQMDAYGIGLNDKDQNVSFTNCQFHNLKKAGISVRDVKNLLVAHSTFHRTCDQLPIGARSVGRNSIIAFIENEFHNPTILEFDAKAVAVWFNAFHTWNKETFPHLNATTHGDRIVSIEFNTVEKFDLNSDDIPLLKSDRVTFNENLLVHCNCDTVASLSLPASLQNSTQRCHSNDGTGLCHLNLTQVTEACRKDPKVSFQGMCQAGKGSGSFANAKTLEEVEHFLRATSIHIESEFMDQMLKYIESPFRVPTLAEEGRKNGTAIHIPGTGTTRSSANRYNAHPDVQLKMFSFGLILILTISAIVNIV